MPPESRGGRQSPLRPNLLSHSTPNLPTLRSLKTASNESYQSTTPSGLYPEHELGSPSEPASIEDFSLDGALDRNSFTTYSDDEEEASEQEDVPNLPNKRPLYAHNHSRSYTSLGPSAFAPPFYNRPPTPLPPSPSLTSLLRPTFSTHNSRPNTPDVSSDESTHPRPTGTNTGATTPTSSALYTTTKPIPRASPRVPTYEYYGFTLYLTSSLAFIIYILWSYLPSPFLHQLGIYYYPNRWWALAIPAWTVMFMVYIYIALASYNTGYLTLQMESVECLVDEAASVAVVDGEGRIVRGLEGPSWGSAGGGGGGVVQNQQGSGQHGGGGKKRGKEKGGSRVSSRQPSLTQLQQQTSGVELDWRELWKEGTDAVMDIPIGGVCEILYGEHGED